MYSDIVIDHFQNPRNVGIIDDADGVAREGNTVCGDLMEVYIKVRDERIVDIKYRTFGCAAAVASGSLGTEVAKGMRLTEAMALTDERVAEMLGGLPPRKLDCSNLAARTLHKAIEDYYRKRSELLEGVALPS